MFGGQDTYGELQYNGIDFDKSTRLVVKADDVYTADGRVVEYTKYKIIAKVYVHEGEGGEEGGSFSGTDDPMQKIHEKLSQPGKRLILKGKGFHEDIDTNETPDVKFGPKPKVRNWTPIGANVTVELIWECELCIKECDSSLPLHPDGFVYSTTVDIDDGWTTRNTTGYFSIQNWWDNGKAKYTPDKWRERFKARTPLGFRRHQEWRISEDKLRLEFSLVDTEIRSPNALPRNMVRAEGTHRTSWSGRSNIRHGNNLTLRFERAANKSPADAWIHALAILNQRMAPARESGRTVLLDEIEVEEDIFGYTTEVSFRWQIYPPLNDFLKVSGLWTPLGTDWSRWRTSMENNKVFDPRGYANWKHKQNDDLIVDLCENTQRPELNDTVDKFRNRTRVIPSLVNVCPPKETSYIKFNVYVAPYRENWTVQHSILQPSPGDSVDTDMLEDGTINFGEGGEIPDILQQSSSASYGIIFYGHALRACYPIPRPKLTQVGDKKPVEVRAKFAQRHSANLLGVTIYAAAWAIHYKLEDSPGEVESEENLAEGIDEAGDAESARGERAGENPTSVR